jgi:hypothetical protein
LRSKNRVHRVASRLLLLVMVLALVYVGLGVGFHVKWHSALADCREAQVAAGEFVEPEVLGGALGLAFDVAFWPVYARANIYRWGTPFATPCSH